MGQRSQSVPRYTLGYREEAVDVSAYVLSTSGRTRTSNPWFQRPVMPSPKAKPHRGDQSLELAYGRPGRQLDPCRAQESGSLSKPHQRSSKALKLKSHGAPIATQSFCHAPRSIFPRVVVILSPNRCKFPCQSEQDSWHSTPLNGVACAYTCPSTRSLTTRLA